MAGFDISKYREMFIDESNEIFKNTYDILENIEKKKDISKEELNDLFRAVHTLKGSASAVDLRYFSKFAHEIESFLAQLRDGEFEFNDSITPNLVESTDRLRDILEIEVDGKIDEVEFYRLTNRLSHELNLSKKQQIVTNVIEPNNSDIDDKIDILNSSDDEFFGFFDDIYIKSDESENITTQIQNRNIDSFNSENIKIDNIEIKNKELPKQDEKLSLTIRVNLSRVDSLMNSIGEIVITNAMINQYSNFIPDNKLKSLITEKLELLNRHIRELQDSVMSIRMIPMEHIYQKFPKLIRDISKQLDKDVELRTFGADVEVDKAMIEGLTDPLTQIIRNSLDHGIEERRVRKNTNKPQIATINIKAEQSNGQIIISISDDGRGIDIDKVSEKALSKALITKSELDSLSYEDKVNLIFKAGLTTAKEVSEISGRGVGMDIVKNNITNLGGVIKIQSQKGIGTTIKMILPLTLAILDGLDILIGDKKYILPLASIVESLQATKDLIKTIGNDEYEILMLRDEFIPIIRLYKLLNIESLYQNIEDGMLIIVKSADKKVALFVDEFLNQQQFVVKSLDKNFKNIQGISGATVRGDGSIGLILDIIGIIDKVKKVNL